MNNVYKNVSGSAKYFKNIKTNKGMEGGSSVRVVRESLSEVIRGKPKMNRELVF